MKNKVLFVALDENGDLILGRHGQYAFKTEEDLHKSIDKSKGRKIDCEVREVSIENGLIIKEIQKGT